MRRTLGALLIVSVLVGCGDDADRTDDRPPETSSSPSASSEDYPLVAMLSGTAAGGSSSDQVTPVPDAQAVEDFSAQLTSDSLRRELARTVAGHQPADGRQLGAAIVAIGCDVPPGVTVTPTDGGFSVQPEKVAEPLQQCLAPVTSIAVVEIPA